MDARSVKYSQENLEHITNRTGTEAYRSLSAAIDYFGGKTLPEHLPSDCDIRLECCLSGPGCNTPVNISKNLNQLMHMYSSILGLITSDDDTDEIELDFLEMTFFRFRIQMDCYLLQAENYTSQDIDRSAIQMIL